MIDDNRGVTVSLVALLQKKFGDNFSISLEEVSRGFGSRHWKLCLSDGIDWEGDYFEVFEGRSPEAVIRQAKRYLNGI